VPLLALSCFLGGLAVGLVVRHWHGLSREAECYAQGVVDGTFRAEEQQQPAPASSWVVSLN